VWTKEGLRPIENVKAKEWVLARDEKTGALVWGRVASTSARVAESVIALTLHDEAGVVQRLEVTPEHPFRVRDRGWVGAGSLVPGQEVHEVEDGAWLQVVRVAPVPKRALVYNFEVEDFHTYFVGDLGAWVHNSCSGYLGRQSNRIGKEGEAKLRAYLGDKAISQKTYKTTLGKRRADFIVDNEIHEAKAGRKGIGEKMQGQIDKDAELLKSGKVDGVTWHFFKSSLTKDDGATPDLVKALKSAGIGMKIHGY
jgi:hypothetical protein